MLINLTELVFLSTHWEKVYKFHGVNVKYNSVWPIIYIRSFLRKILLIFLLSNTASFSRFFYSNRATSYFSTLWDEDGVVFIALGFSISYFWPQLSSFILFWIHVVYTFSSYLWGRLGLWLTKLCFCTHVSRMMSVVECLDVRLYNSPEPGHIRPALSNHQK